MIDIQGEGRVQGSREATAPAETRAPAIRQFIDESNNR